MAHPVPKTYTDLPVDKRLIKYVGEEGRARMPDISMCFNDDCQLAKTCYRHEAEPSDWQSYANFEGGKDCRGYWPMDRAKLAHTQKNK